MPVIPEPFAELPIWKETPPPFEVSVLCTARWYQGRATPIPVDVESAGMPPGEHGADDCCTRCLTRGSPRRSWSGRTAPVTSLFKAVVTVGEATVRVVLPVRLTVTRSG